MPFKSQAQRRFLFAKHPAVAKKFATDSTPGQALPQHVGQPSMPSPVKPAITPSFSGLSDYLDSKKMKPPKGF